MRARSDRLVEELEAADLVVIGAPIGHHPVTPALAEWHRRARTSRGFGAPLYAMGLNPELQAWFSHVIRADRTFRYTAEGPRGLLRARRQSVLAAQTKPWNSEAINAHQVHCIDTQLRFMGIDEVATIASDREFNPVHYPRRLEAPAGASARSLIRVQARPCFPRGPAPETGRFPQA
jgi:FMN-dependent NADH-azoreductase